MAESKQDITDYQVELSMNDNGLFQWSIWENDEMDENSKYKVCDSGRRSYYGIERAAREAWRKVEKLCDEVVVEGASNA